jgi:hypothetical protein
MNFDETNKKCITDFMIGPLLAFEEDLKLIFTIYLGENLV